MLRETPSYLRLNPHDDIVIACREPIENHRALGRRL